MKKIKKHIEKLHFVKVYISDKNGQGLTHFEGVIFDQNEDFLIMCDLSDFNYDGFVILRKEDISDIKRSENEKFFNRILKEEKIIKEIRRRKRDLDFDLDNMEEMFRQLKKMGIATIVECLYDSEESFQIGPIVKAKEKKMKMDYFNSRGEFNTEPVGVKYKDITFFRLDSPYANLFFKYAEHIETAEKVEKKKKKKPKVAKTKLKSKEKPESKSTKGKAPKEKKTKKIKDYKRPKQTERLMLVV